MFNPYHLKYQWLTGTHPWLWSASCRVVVCILIKYWLTLKLWQAGLSCKRWWQTRGGTRPRTTGVHCGVSWESWDMTEAAAEHQLRWMEARSGLCCPFVPFISIHHNISARYLYVFVLSNKILCLIFQCLDKSGCWCWSWKFYDYHKLGVWEILGYYFTRFLH